LRTERFQIGKSGICETSVVTIQFNRFGKAIYDLTFPWSPFQEMEARKIVPGAKP
jgi:hypothetical protein